MILYRFVVQMVDQGGTVIVLLLDDNRIMTSLI